MQCKFSYLINGGFDHFHHLWVLKLIDNVLENVTVRHKAQSTEHNDDRDLLTDVRQDGDDTLTNGTFTDTLE